MFRILPETKFDFIGARKIAFVISSILSVLGIVAAVMVWTGNANMGIDFAGGVMVSGYFEQPVTIDQVRTTVGSQFHDAQINQLKGIEGHPHAFIVKTKSPKAEAEAKEKLAGLKQLFATGFSGNSFTLLSQHSIGPAVGETLRNDTQKAVLLSLLGIFVYIWFRFDRRSGVAAAIATFHDVLAVLGIFWIFGLEFDLLLVTALLTVAGYSLTDTVVVYDRIRENLKKFRGKAEFIPAVNFSINEMLARTVNTSLTVLLVVGALYLFGGEVLHNFSLAMILGVLIGTYSSWFVASPIIVEWESRRPLRFK
jgi:preprotein translocase subunit SecF